MKKSVKLGNKQANKKQLQAKNKNNKKETADICTSYLLLFSRKGKKHEAGSSAFLLANFSTATLCQGSQRAEPFSRELWFAFPTDC